MSSLKPWADVVVVILITFTVFNILHAISCSWLADRKKKEFHEYHTLRCLKSFPSIQSAIFECNIGRIGTWYILMSGYLPIYFMVLSFLWIFVHDPNDDFHEVLSLILLIFYGTYSIFFGVVAKASFAFTRAVGSDGTILNVNGIQRGLSSYALFRCFGKAQHLFQAFRNKPGTFVGFSVLETFCYLFFMAVTILVTIAVFGGVIMGEKTSVTIVDVSGFADGAFEYQLFLNDSGVFETGGACADIDSTDPTVKSNTCESELNASVSFDDALDAYSVVLRNLTSSALKGKVCAIEIAATVYCTKLKTIRFDYPHRFQLSINCLNCFQYSETKTPDATVKHKDYVMIYTTSIVIILVMFGMDLLFSNIYAITAISDVE